MLKEKLRYLLSQLNLIKLSFLAILIYILINGFTLESVGIFAVISCLLGFFRYLDDKKQPPITQAILNEIEKIKAVVSAMKMEKIRRNPDENKRFF